MTYLSVSGTVERVVDLRDSSRLGAFLEIVAGFKIPADLMKRARAMKIYPKYPQSVDELLERLLDKNWRWFPMGFDIPAPSQFFGHLALAAGIDGILFPRREWERGDVAWPSSRGTLLAADPPWPSMIQDPLGPRTRN